MLIRKYPDLTTPTPAYGGKVFTAFSPKAWVHVLVDINTGKLERLDGVTAISLAEEKRAHPRRLSRGPLKIFIDKWVGVGFARFVQRLPCMRSRLLNLF